MKKQIYLWLCVLILCGGCFPNPFKDLKSREAKIDKSEQKIDKIDEKTLEAARAYMHGTEYSLSLDPNPSKWASIAYDLSGKANTTLGAPKMEGAKAIQNIVDKSVSTNSADNELAKRLLNEMDLKVIKLQKEKDEALAEKEKEILKYKKVAEENSQLAQIGAFIKRTIFYIKWGIIGFIIFRIAGLFVPPPYSSLFHIFDHIAGGLFGLFSRALPQAKEAAKLVSKEAYDEMRKTTEALVGAIEEIKADPAIKEKIKPVLKDYTEKEVTRRIISDVKNKLNL